ncbi:hypothetical protein CHLRE_02g110450v5 [Chlamydomonas reinhardtii]|uniref:Uncharacterized protein n=1 Tax=Chlamydomonas reinhardtii TaxID=3055 RepID=A8I3E4_CHLRE|nr:uncharacterized protein CHLRE_02g110450v5 [Chlamydomonas reinhardtii]PNW87136.1 hypothetical protein CHLRE_02g110450v5 [Chlamydomonas reinhardtii]|eukprot:XP_001699935.1 predicted protein [Chlamydomonas reinhardtii]
MPPTKACCAHDHDCEAADCGVAYSLYKHVAVDQVRCLNEASVGSCRNILRPWHTRLDAVETPLRSNEDEDEQEVLIHVPFDGSVKLKAISVIARGPPGTAPGRMRAYINRDDLDFGTAAQAAPVQEWELAVDGDARGIIEYPTQVAKFTGVHSLDLLLSGASGGMDYIEVHFLGLKGEFAERRRQAVETVYELRPVPGDGNKIPGIGDGAHWHA